MTTPHTPPTADEVRKCKEVLAANKWKIAPERNLRFQCRIEEARVMLDTLERLISKHEGGHGQ
jgi:hypothetical protein